MADNIIGPPLPEILTRKEALAKELPLYFTGKPCKHGHIAQRRTESRSCWVCYLILKERDRKLGKGTASKRAWREANPDKERALEASRDYAARTANRRAAKFGAAGRITKHDTKWIRETQRYMCAICGERVEGKGHIDHIISLSKGGSNSVPNLQLLCAPCNRKKH